MFILTELILIRLETRPKTAMLKGKGASEHYIINILIKNELGKMVNEDISKMNGKLLGSGSVKINNSDNIKNSQLKNNLKTQGIKLNYSDKVRK